MFDWCFSKLHITQLIAVFDITLKIIIQLYLCLLKTHLPDAKAPMRQPMDIVAPHLDKKNYSFSGFNQVPDAGVGH
jgi:hypothetical protein